MRHRGEMLAGIHENEHPAATARRAGGNATRDFTANVITPGDLVKRVKTVCGPAWAAGQTAVWSFKPSPPEVKSGAWKAPVQALANYLKAHPDLKIVVIIWHEPENDTPKWFRRPDDFVSLFERCAEWFRAVCPDMVLVHAALGYRYATGTKDITDATARQWRTSANVHCLDIYSGRSNPLATIAPELSGYTRWRQYVAGDDPWGFTERGWAADPGDYPLRAATIDRESAWLASLAVKPRIYLVWSTEGTEKDDKLILDRTGQARADALVAQLLAGAKPGTIAAKPAPASTQPATSAPVPASFTVPCPLCHGSGTHTFTPGGPVVR